MVKLEPSTSGSPTSKEELRTLFASGFPQDVKERELYILFHACPGYEGAILKQPCQLNRVKAGINQAQGPVAFLSFASRKDAEAAKEKFHGFQIDPHLENMTLKIEFAKANTKSRYRSREVTSMVSSSGLMGGMMGESVAFPLLQPQQMAQLPLTIDTGAIWPVSTYQELPQIPMENFSPILVPSDNTLPLHFIESQRRKHNQNSVSLIVSNLKENIREKQLAEIFRQFPGFLNSRMTSIRGTAIVEYHSEACAHVVIGCLNGHINVHGKEVAELGGLKIDQGSSGH